MSDLVIRAEGLSKLYRIGHAHQRHDSLLGAAVGALASPLRNFQSLRRLDTANARTEDEDEDAGLLWALRDVSFEVRRGEVLGLVGRNGAGKSTLLKVLSRITEPTRGRVRLRGRVASLLEVGTGFNSELTGRENVYLNGTILGMTRREIDRKFDEIVEFSGISKFLDTPVKRYSSGMTVRLAFAVAAHLEPDILIVDEVLAVGDAEFQKKCLGKMREVSAGDGRTILFVSHNNNAVSTLCSRAILFDKGRLVMDGPVDEVLHRHLRNCAKLPDSDTIDRYRAPGMEDLFRSITVDGQPLPGEVVVRAERPLQIEIRGRADRRVIGLRPGIHLFSEDNVRVMVLATAFTRLGPVDVDGDFVLTCDLPRLPLIPGRYYLSVNADVVNVGMIESLDYVGTMTVQPVADSDADLIPHYGIHGYFVADHNWAIC